MSGAEAEPTVDHRPGTFRPAPGAAPLRRMIAAQARIETRLLLRNGEQVLIALGIPLLVLLGGAYGPIAIDLDLLVPGVLALAVLSTAFTSLAIATGFERRYGVLKRLGASPLSRGGLLAGKSLSVLAVQVVQFGILGAAGLLLGWRPEPAGIAPAVLLVILGTAAFSSLALLLAGTLRAEATLAVANLVYVVLLIGGAVVIPLAEYPPVAQAIVQWLPSTALAEGLREAMVGGAAVGADPGSGLLGQLMVLAAWLVVGAAATARTFRWE